MKFTIRIKLLLCIIPLIILMITVCVIVYNIMQKSLKYMEEILYQEVPVADVSMEAMIALTKSHVLIRKYLLENEIIQLDRIEDNFKETILNFDMYISVMIYGSNSEEFKKTENGKLYDMWIKDEYKDKIIIKSNIEIIELSKQVEKLHKMFRENSKKMMAHHKKIIRDYKYELYGEKFEIKKYFSEIDNLNKNIYFLLTTIEKKTYRDMRLMLIESNRSMVGVNFMIVIITIFSIFIGIMVYLLFCYTITNPIVKIEESTKEITKGNFNCKKIKIRSRDEIGKLASSFNIMTESLRGRMEKERQIYEKILIRSEKLTSIGELSASIIHEIRQPLNVIKVTADSFIYMLSQKKKLPELYKNDLNKIKKVANNSDKINQIIKNFQDIIKSPGQIQKIYININNEINMIVKFFSHKLKTHLIELILDLDNNIDSIKFSDIQFQQIISNLLNNAINAHNSTIKNNKKIIIKTKNNKKYILLEIVDNATGIKASIKEKIFEPLFSTNANDDSMGLGLFIIKRILILNNSKINIINNNNGGATFKIIINK